jgi:hypothetical protein
MRAVRRAARRLIAPARCVRAAGERAGDGLGAGVAMLASLLLVAMFTFQPRSLFSAASQAGASIAAPHGTVAAPQASAQP